MPWTRDAPGQAGPAVTDTGTEAAIVWAASNGLLKNAFATARRAETRNPVLPPHQSTVGASLRAPDRRMAGRTISLNRGCGSGLSVACQIPGSHKHA